LNEGFSANVSERALIELNFAFFAQDGINPHKKKVAALCPSLGIAKRGWLGAMLKRGAKIGGKSKPPK
jgi:hypothetical protein